jgi:TonB family protein
VVVEVLVDALGKVQGVRLVEGSEPEFNHVVLEHLKNSTFTPALDRSGNPVACSFRLPIGFTLR